MPTITTTNKINWHFKLEGEGSGPTLFFLHGWGVNQDIWKQQVTHFKEECRVLTIDLPGHGDTPWQNVSLEEMADDIKELLAVLGLDAVHFVGSSMGGLIGLKLYQRHPKVFQSMTFVGSLPKFAKSDDFHFGLEAPAVRKLTQQVEQQYPSIVNIFFRSLFTRTEREDAKFQWAQKFRRNQKLPEQAALLAFLDFLEREDLRAVLPAIKVPVLCINGSDDTIVPVAYLEYIKSQMPRVQCYRMEKGGHFPFIVQAEEFNERLEKILKNYKGTPGRQSPEHR